MTLTEACVCIVQINDKGEGKKSSGTHQLPQLRSTQVDFPALRSAGHASLVGHVLQRALLLLCSGPETICLLPLNSTHHRVSL